MILHSLSLSLISLNDQLKSVHESSITSLISLRGAAEYLRARGRDQDDQQVRALTCCLITRRSPRTLCRIRRGFIRLCEEGKRTAKRRSSINLPLFVNFHRSK